MQDGCGIAFLYMERNLDIMQLWKKLCTLLTAGMLALSVSPAAISAVPEICAAAAENTSTYGKLKYTLTSDRAIITSCEKSAVSVTIPEEIEGKPVLQIAENAFYSHTELTDVTIPDTVRALGSRAFYGCSKLNHVQLPKYLLTIGSGCFMSCTSLSEITIPGTVRNIGNSVFFQTPWLEERQAEDPLVQVNHIVIDGEKCTDETLVIPEGVTEICDAAFMVNLKIKEVILPESLQTIGASAFWQCHSLEKVEIPDSVTRIDKRAFYDCTALREITFPAGVTTIPAYVLANCLSLEKVTLKGQLTEISQSAFSLSTQLTDVYTVLSESEWNALPIGDDNDGLDGAVIHYDTPAALNLGDMDNSGKVDSTEVFYLMLGIAQRGVGLESGWTAAQEQAADVDGNGIVDSTDVFYTMLYIARNSVGIPTEWADICG